MAAALPWAISNANRGVTFVHTRFWTTLNFGKFDLIEHFHRMLVTAPAADLGRFTAIRFRSARLRQNWEFARHTSNMAAEAYARSTAKFNDFKRDGIFRNHTRFSACDGPRSGKLRRTPA